MVRLWYLTLCNKSTFCRRGIICGGNDFRVVKILEREAVFNCLLLSATSYVKASKTANNHVAS